MCEKIKGTVKRTVTKRNLQSTSESKQILNVMQMYTFCNNLLSKVKILFLSEEDTEKGRITLHSRFETGQRVIGTRSFNFFQPASSDEVTAKRVTSNSDICLRKKTFLTKQD